jgi:hypothetical protein
MRNDEDKAMSNIVFLDMDGVISTSRAQIVQRAFKPHPDYWIDPIGMHYLNLLCKAGNAIVVVSSSWRIGEDRQSFFEMLKRNGFSGDLHADWATQRINGPRGLEVAEWLTRHVDTDRHVILDDESDFLAGQPLIKTSMNYGIGLNDLIEALAILRPDVDGYDLIRAVQGAMVKEERIK